jgi:putative ABC transport system permease protein
MGTWLSKLHRLFSRRGLDDELQEEMQAHIDLEAAENVARGMTAEAARAAARRNFGNATLARERSQEAWSFSPLENFLQELRYALRGFRRSPGFLLVVIVTLALGIGANTAIFSVVDAVLLHPLPYPDAERLVRLGETNQKSDGFSVTWINYQHWRQDNRSFEDMAAYDWLHMTLIGMGDPMLTRVAAVTPRFLTFIGAQPVLGCLFTEADDGPGAPDVIVVGRKFWMEKLSGDRKSIGRILDLDGKSYQVIGVASLDLEFFSKPIDFYVPLGPFHKAELRRSQHGSIRALGLLKPGVSVAAAKADLDSIMQRLAQTDPGPENEHRVDAISLLELRTQSIRTTLLILMCAVALVLAIACANVASVILVRNSARAKEIAIRAALGAGRRRLILQLLVESLLLSTLGGLAGLLLAQWCLRALVAVGPRDIPRLAQSALSAQVLLFAGFITLVTGALVGLAPVLTTRKLGLVDALRCSSHGTTRAGAGQSFRNALVVGEIGITMVLVFASGLLLRSLMAAQNSPPGFAPEHLLALELILPPSYKGDEAVRQFHARLTEDLARLPGVESVGAVNCPPSSGGCGDWFYSIIGQPAPAQGAVPIAFVNMADPDYFRTMQIPLREGRGFSVADRGKAPPVAIVNETFARKWWPNQTAVGHSIKFGGPYQDGQTLEIVGVVGDVSQIGLDAEPGPEMYLPFLQQPTSAMVVMVRTAGDPELLTATVRQRVTAIDRNLPVQSLQAFTRTMGSTLERRRFSTLLLALFAGLAMVLALVGIYGLLGYWVSVREKDIAIRVALGARRSAIVYWVGSQTLRLTAAGIACGSLAAMAASRWMQSLVFGVSPHNPVTLVAAGMILVSLAALAAAVPAWRAVRVDPVQKLRDT